MVFYRDLEANQWVVPNSGYHMKIKASDRLATFLDDGKYDTVALPSVATDPLKFRDQQALCRSPQGTAPEDRRR